MTNALSIAVAQTCPVKGDVDANIADHLRLVRFAALEGADVVVFPELSLTGYELDLAMDLAFSEHDPRLAPLVDVAADSGTVVIVGAPVRLGPRLTIGACILLPDRTSTLYTKQRLGAFPATAARDGVPPPESTVFGTADRDPLIELGGHKAAMAICADIGSPSHPKRAADRGAAVYLASMFVIPADFEGDASRLEGFAVQHSMAVALANFGGPTGGLVAAGRSSIWSEAGELLVRLDPAGTGVAVATKSAAGWRSRTVSGHVS